MSWMTDLRQAAATRQTDSVEVVSGVATNVAALQPQLQRLHEFLSDLGEQLKSSTLTLVMTTMCSVTPLLASYANPGMWPGPRCKVS